MDLINLAKKQWDRTAAIVLTVIGIIALIAGWAGVNGTELLAEQTRYIVSGGIVAIFLLGLGATLWISADLRDEWRKLDRIEQSLGNGVLRWAGDTSASATGSVDVTPGDAGSHRRQAGDAGQNGGSSAAAAGSTRPTSAANPNA